MQLSLTEGQRLQREGQETVAAKNAVFLSNARYLAKHISNKYGRVTSDDIRQWSEEVGQYPTHHNAWGCIFKQKGWTVIGRQPTKLPNGHARKICVWKWEGV